MKTFYNVLANSFIATTTNMVIWFAITFYLYLETQSVLATSILSGIYLVGAAGTGFWLGSIVDHNKKKNVMLLSSIISLITYALCLIIYIFVDKAIFKDINNLILWAFVLLIMFGVLAGNLRNIALPTTVTLLVPADNRDKANGLVGTISGISFLIVSVISGLMIGYLGMLSVLILAVVLTILAIFHLSFLKIEEKEIIHLNQEESVGLAPSIGDKGQVDGIANEPSKKSIDIPGTIKAINAVPGLFALILFATINNFLGGVFMSLMDPYGLSLVSVQVWGLIWGFLSTAFIVGGVIISKFGLGKNPLRSLFLANIAIWTISIFFTIQPSIIFLTIGMFLYLCVVPFIEASEQTIIQKVVPQERQGRVFGFAQSVEQAASPLTAFLIGPLTQFIFIPLMNEGGAGANLIGSWFGTGNSRGIALVFTVTGIIGLVFTLLAMSTKFYRMLSEYYLNSESTEVTEKNLNLETQA